MSKTYTPGTEADILVEELLAKGNYRNADEVLRASLRLLKEYEEYEEELGELRKLVDEGDAAYASGDYSVYTNADEFLADIKRLGDEQLPPKP